MEQITYPSFRQLVAKTFSIFSQNWKRLVGIAFIPTILTAITFLALSFFLAANVFSQLLARNYTFLLIGIPVTIFFLIALSIFNFWSQSALFYAVVNIKKEFSVRQAYSRSWSYVGRFLQLSLLIGLMTLGGLPLFLIPGLLVMFYSSLAFLVFFSEDLSGWDAIYRSQFYIRSNAKQFFVRIIIWLLLLVLTSGLVDSFFNNVNSPFIESSVRFVYNLVTGSLSIIFLFLNYQHLKLISPDVIPSSYNHQKAFYTILAILPLVYLVLALAASFLFQKSLINNNGLVY